MDLNKISTVVRPRSKWQAIDLGFKMAARWYLPLLSGWLILALPTFILLNLLLSDMIWLSALLVWWLKPLWERMQLVYLSRAQFGESLSLPAQFKLWRQNLLHQSLPRLSWRRLSLQRAYFAPIVQLEALSGSQYRARRRLFNGPNQQASLWLTLVLVHFESVITIALLSLAASLIPEQIENPIWDSYFLSSFDLISNLLYFISMAVIAPFYSACGFALYLNQRTQLEGWDIEITFRRMARRHKQRANAPGLLSLLTALALPLLLLGSLTTSPVYANEPEQQPERQQAKALAEQIKADPLFNQTTVRKLPSFYLNSTFEPEQSTTDQVPQWLKALLGFIANSFEWLLSALVLALLALLIIRYRHWLAQYLPLKTDPPPQAAATTESFGLDLSGEHLVDDPAAGAQTLWQQGHKRQALSLLYRASLLQLVKQQHIEVHDSFTEGECLQQVKANAPQAIAEYFGQLTRCWQQLAYADQVPSAQTMEQLFGQWQPIFTEPDDEH